MNKTLLSALNWLDAFLRPVTVPPFVVRKAMNGRGQPQIEIDNLKVWLYQEGKLWISQGLDIDYAAAGETPEKAKENFSRGLGATLLINLDKRGEIESVIRPAPARIWLDWRVAARHLEQAAKQPSAEAIDSDLFPQPRLRPIFFENCAA